MTKPFAWINGMLRTSGLTPPDWAKFVSDDGRFEIGNWFCLYEEEPAKANYEHVNACFPTRRVLPFARDGASDDIACFVISDAQSNAAIAIIHDNAMPGTEVEERHETFEDWVNAVLEDTDLALVGRE